MSSTFLPRRAIIMGRRRSAASSSAVSSNDQPAPTASAPASLQVPPTPENDSLELIAADLQGCPRCKLCQNRKNMIVGEGNPRAELVFVGEAPDEQEDTDGRPFVGKAGQLLDRMIQAMGLQREQVYICNVVKCHPPGNRDPEVDEIDACAPFLTRQLDIIRPKVVVALGKFAAQTLLQTETPIAKLRGSFYPYRNGAKLMPTLHPNYLLQNPESKREVWEDLQKVASELGLSIPKRG